MFSDKTRQIEFLIIYYIKLVEAEMPVKMVANQNKDMPMVQNPLKHSKVIVNAGLGACANGAELATLHQLIFPNPLVFNYQCAEVKRDLLNALQSLNPLRAELCGSAAMNLACKGKFRPNRSICRLQMFKR